MLDVMNVSKTYKEPGFFSTQRQKILTDITFKVKRYECKSVIGESGSGKSTLMRLILGIEKPDKGQILFEGKKVSDVENRRGKMSVVFQDYLASMNHNRNVKQNLLEPILNLKQTASDEALDELLKGVGLNGDYLLRYPHELSGGEGQRVCIARALAVKPEFLVLDEAISSLDVSVQVKILDLLLDIREKYNITYLFVTHDIQAATYISDSILILKDGEIVEDMPVIDIKNAKKEYSKKLFGAVITV